MEDKINLKAVEAYCNQFTHKVLDGYFASHQKITGPEILQLSSIHQINLFAIHGLFTSWQKENARIKSPYFDYAHPAVMEAQENLMNTLSNHISVAKDDFFVLFREAAKNTLMLIIDPYDFYADLIEGKTGYLELAVFKKELKYIKINKGPLEKLVERIAEKGINQLSGNEAFSMLDTILEELHFTPEDVEQYLEKFSGVYPLTLGQLYESKATAQIKSGDTGIQVQERPKTNVQNRNTVNEQTQVKATLNEKHTDQSKHTLADNFKKIERIKDSLTINQKFMFTKVLFHGDFELFSKAVEDLDRQDNLNGAMKYLEKNYDEWDRESEEFHEFMELIEMRFHRP